MVVPLMFVIIVPGATPSDITIIPTKKSPLTFVTSITVEPTGNVPNI